MAAHIDKHRLLGLWHSSNDNEFVHSKITQGSSMVQKFRNMNSFLFVVINIE